MKRSAILLSSLGIFGLTLAAYAVEDTSWGALKTRLNASQSEGVAPHSAAKLTVSRAMAGGLRPGMVSISGTWEFVIAPPTGESSDEPEVSCPEGYIPFILRGSAELGHMGAVTGLGSDCGALDLSHFILGQATLTDGNGDELNVVFRGVTVGFDPTTGISQVASTITVAGGTGRLAGASGRFSDFGTITPNPDGSVTLVTTWLNAMVLLPNDTP